MKSRPHDINAENLRALASIADKLAPIAGTIGGLYLDGTLEVKHVDDFVVGYFYPEDDWWMFSAGELATGEQ